MTTLKNLVERAGYVYIETKNQDTIMKATELFDDHKSALVKVPRCTETTDPLLTYYCACFYDKHKMEEPKNRYFKMAENVLTISAKNGSMIDAYNLAQVYKQLKNSDYVINYFLMAADFGNYEAWYALGKYYETISKDYEQMVKYYERAVENNIMGAILDLATYYSENKQYDKMMTLLEKGISLNTCSVPALRLGEYYESEKKYSQMKKYYDIAVNCKDGNAMLNYALYYKHTEDKEEQDVKIELMIKYLKSACDQFNVKAMVELGSYYETIKDTTNMAVYYNLAIDNGDTTALLKLAKYYQELKDETNASKYYVLAAEKGSKDALEELNKIYVTGGKCREGYKIFMGIFEKGNESANTNILNCFSSDKKILEEFLDEHINDMKQIKLNKQIIEERELRPGAPKTKLFEQEFNKKAGQLDKSMNTTEETKRTDTTLSLGGLDEEMPVDGYDIVTIALPVDKSNILEYEESEEEDDEISDADIDEEISDDEEEKATETPVPVVVPAQVDQPVQEIVDQNQEIDEETPDAEENTEPERETVEATNATVETVTETQTVATTNT